MMFIDVTQFFSWFMDEFTSVLPLARNTRITEYNRQDADIQRKV
jgi:hypothetical protein